MPHGDPYDLHFPGHFSISHDGNGWAQVDCHLVLELAIPSARPSLALWTSNSRVCMSPRPTAKKHLLFASFLLFSEQEDVRLSIYGAGLSFSEGQGAAVFLFLLSASARLRNWFKEAAVGMGES